MRREVKRCIHCQTRYLYQSSGYGCGKQENDDQYCSECMTVIIEALSNIPKKVERFDLLLQDDDERKSVLEEYERQKKNPPRLFGGHGPLIQQYRPGLFRHDEKGKVIASLHINVIHFRDSEYEIHEWSDDHEPVKVVKMMERDLLTGSMQPWRDFP